MTPTTQHTTMTPKIRAPMPSMIRVHQASTSYLRAGSASIYCSIL